MTYVGGLVWVFGITPGGTVLGRWPMHRWTSCDPNLVLMGTLDLDVLSMSRYLDDLTRPPT